MRNRSITVCALAAVSLACFASPAVAQSSKWYLVEGTDNGDFEVLGIFATRSACESELNKLSDDRQTEVGCYIQQEFGEKFLDLD